MYHTHGDEKKKGKEDEIMRRLRPYALHALVCPGRTVAGSLH